MPPTDDVRDDLVDDAEAEVPPLHDQNLQQLPMTSLYAAVGFFVTVVVATSQAVPSRAKCFANLTALADANLPTMLFAEFQHRPQTTFAATPTFGVVYPRGTTPVIGKPFTSSKS